MAERITTIEDLQRQLKETREGNAELMRRLMVTRVALAEARANGEAAQEGNPSS